MKTRPSLLPAAWIATGALLVGLLTGCAWSVGSRGTEAHYEPTRGQELLDLKKAKDQGLLTDEEYETQRQRVLGP
jgi:hypothetical protein